MSDYGISSRKGYQKPFVQVWHPVHRPFQTPAFFCSGSCVECYGTDWSVDAVRSRTSGSYPAGHISPLRPPHRSTPRSVPGILPLTAAPVTPMP
jgi:hypothetical protein